MRRRAMMSKNVGGAGFWTIESDLTSKLQHHDMSVASGYTLNGSSKMSQMNDLSGAGNHTPAEGTPSVNIIANAQNGLSVARFVTHAGYVPPAGVFTGKTQLSATILVKRTAEKYIYFGSVGGANRFGFYLVSGNLNLWENASVGSALQLPTVSYSAGEPYMIISFHLQGVNRYVRQNGVQASDAQGVTSGASTITPSYFYRLNDFGIFSGDLAEMVWHQSTYADMLKTEGRLAHKWGITSVLDNSHPYKVSAP